MKKYIVLFSICWFSIYTFAQLSSNTGKFYKSFTGVDYVFLFNGINSSTSINFDGIATGLKWSKYNATTPIYSGVNSFDQLENATGYVLEDATGKKITFWVIDYQKYIATINSVEAENNPANQCTDLKILISSTVPTLFYKTEAGITVNMPRKFKLNFKTQEWTTSWNKVDKSEVIELPLASINVVAPLCNTTFSISGDQYAEDLGISKTFVGSEYNAVAVKSNLKTVVTTRSETNEGERPAQPAQVSGSSPLDIQFLSNANEPTAQYYKWKIFKGNVLLQTFSDKDQRYTFTESGDYKVKLETSNKYCNTADSVDVKVSVSALQVPNVFTPNGDGMNDEFRVAYKSLASFQCWVLNRWGRKIFYWTDPQKGWDGTIGGKNAAEGAYFYIIKAVGTDGVKQNRKGDINLLR